MLHTILVLSVVLGLATLLVIFVVQKIVPAPILVKIGAAANTTWSALVKTLAVVWAVAFIAMVVGIIVTKVPG